MLQASCVSHDEPTMNARNLHAARDELFHAEGVIKHRHIPFTGLWLKGHLLANLELFSELQGRVTEARSRIVQ